MNANRISLRAPLVVGIGGTTRQGSSTERAVKHSLEVIAQGGVATRFYGGEFLASLPHYAPELPGRTPGQNELVESIRQANGLVIASSGYHGNVTGLMKNAIDLFEDLREDKRPYLDGRVVACIAVAGGSQAAVTTLMALRSIVHALRGWPIPLGVTAITNREQGFDEAGNHSDERVNEQLKETGRQVLKFLRWQGVLLQAQ